MAVRYRSDETDPDFVVVIWIADEGDPPLHHAGIRNAHVTQIISGRVRFTYDDAPRAPFELGAGEQVTLDVRRAYTVEAIGRGTHEGRCFYPRNVPDALAEIQHLRKATETVMVSR